ncbi:glutathione S-transferase N-terminal domain-containing protein, partial [Stenotrophomonas sp. YIM B06876]|uniref:glutaredoxin family protein n=1 Tax=Stenotrophomonas sp. YIM B06876 TaxID=3060211 RepID=UPI0027381A41
TRPKGLARAPAAQDAVDLACRDLALYQYQTCPFCIKVRQEMRRLSLNIAHVNAQHAGPHRAELLQHGGQTKVPCLKITDAGGASRWLYDSEKIIAYLRGRFAPSPQA